MEAVQTSETMVKLYQSTWFYNQEDSHLQLEDHLVGTKEGICRFGYSVKA
jgi:hypothetical protein